MIQKPLRPTVYLWKSGHAVFATDTLEGALPLMTGTYNALITIMDGNAERLELTNDTAGWVITTVATAETPGEAYVAASLWLAKVARLYANTSVSFFVNAASNTSVQRATARAIYQTLN